MVNRLALVERIDALPARRTDLVDEPVARPTDRKNYGALLRKETIVSLPPPGS